LNRLKLWRQQRHLTQHVAAAQLGLGVSTYGLLEAGRLRPSSDQFRTLRAFFGQQADSLFEEVRERVEVPA